jgi:hypothetical protein
MENVAQRSPRVTSRRRLDGTFEIIRETPQGRPVTNKTRDPEKHQGYVQEWIGGYRTPRPRDVRRQLVNRVGSPGDGRDHLRRQRVARPGRLTHASTNNHWNCTHNGLNSRPPSRRALNIITTYTRLAPHRGRPAAQRPGCDHPARRARTMASRHRSRSARTASRPIPPAWQNHSSARRDLARPGVTGLDC